MPEQNSGRFSDPRDSDSLQWLCVTLARVEARQEVMERTLTELTAQLADLDAVLRRAAAEPAPPRSSPRRGGDTPLRLVKLGG